MAHGSDPSDKLFLSGPVTSPWRGVGVGVQAADTAQSAKQLLTLHIALCGCGPSESSRGVGVRLEAVGSLKHSGSAMVAPLGPFSSQAMVDLFIDAFSAEWHAVAQLPTCHVSCPTAENKIHWRPLAFTIFWTIIMSVRLFPCDILGYWDPLQMIPVQL